MRGAPLPDLSLRASAARAALVLACAVYFVLAQGFAGALPVWHEEVATHAMVPGSAFTWEGGALRELDVCPPRTTLQFLDARPSLVLCAGGLAWPVLVSAYSGGVAFWPLQVLRPLHDGHPIALRRLGVFVGLAALLVLFSLVSRVGGPMRGAAAVLVASVLPGVLVGHSILVLFELGPPLLLMVAAWVVVSRPDVEAPPSARRALLAGAIAGLAVLGNIKAAVVLVPVVLVALRSSPALRSMRLRAWGAGLLGLAVVASPLFIAAAFDPARGFEDQVWHRLDVASRHLDLRLLLAESWNAVIYAGDILYYFELLAGGDGALRPLTLTVSGLALLHSFYALFQTLRGRPHDPVAAACGGLQLTFIVFVWLAYEQTPAANYAPISYAHAGSVACAIVSAGRFARSKGLRAGVGLGIAGVLAAFSLVSNDLRRGSPADFVDISINVQAERRLAEHLARTGSANVVTTSYNLALLPAAFTGAPTGRLDLALAACRGDSHPEACEVDVASAVLQARPGARFVVPTACGLIDEAPSRRIRETLAAAAARRGGHLATEAEFKDARGAVVLAIVVAEGLGPPQAPRAPAQPAGGPSLPTEAPADAGEALVLPGLPVGAALADGGVVRAITRREGVVRVDIDTGDATYAIELVAPGAWPFAPPATGGGYDVFYVMPQVDPATRPASEARAQGFARAVARALDEAARPKPAH